MKRIFSKSLQLHESTDISHISGEYCSFCTGKRRLIRDQAESHCQKITETALECSGLGKRIEDSHVLVWPYFVAPAESKIPAHIF
jgi:hypothetical protein